MEALTVQVLAGKEATMDMTEGKCVGGEAPSALLGDHNVQVLVGSSQPWICLRGKLQGVKPLCFTRGQYCSGFCREAANYLYMT